MAVSNTLEQATGNQVRSGMCLVDMDGTASFLIGTVIGADIGTTDAAGADVHVVNTQAFTSTVAMTGAELMSAWADKIQDAVGGVSGSKAWMTENTKDHDYVLHVEAQYSPASPAIRVSIATPTFVPGT